MAESFIDQLIKAVSSVTDPTAREICTLLTHYKAGGLNKLIYDQLCLRASDLDVNRTTPPRYPIIGLDSDATANSKRMMWVANHIRLMSPLRMPNDEDITFIRLSTEAKGVVTKSNAPLPTGTATPFPSPTMPPKKVNEIGCYIMNPEPCPILTPSLPPSAIAMRRIYCDGSMNKYSGNAGWGSVVDSNGLDLITMYNNLIEYDMSTLILSNSKKVILSRFDDVKSQQNNGAELMALIAALRIALSVSQVQEIATDSDLLFKYWSLGRVAAATREKMDPKKAERITECTRLRNEFEKRGGKLIKVGGDENKADLGFHR